uniref:RNA polymerase beta'' subunit n=1 Tax=Chroodactylon ornatum TaxID=139907 RepID=UPI001FCD5D81|nr:RNA polymerase beta'' subunit [Chroodactylon ornatum]UNJ14644.1 RNA polymerase beta'' subunit [Chroodactylon ornatum]
MMTPYSPYYNKIIDKKELRTLIRKAFRNYGTAAASKMVDSLKDLGFEYATKAGFSLSLEDLRIPPYKKTLLDQTYSQIKSAEYKYLRGEITTVERFQKVIDTWSSASETLKNEVINYFRTKDPLNSVHIMAFSGARGNISQVRQLVGMRGLMSDPSGQIINIPISSNFREGLNVTEYFISSYGARKGLVDTALRTADSGYLTRRLVDVAQDVIIREKDCQTKRGIILVKPKTHQLVGRVLVENIYHPTTGVLLGNTNQDIDLNLAEEIVEANVTQILVRSPLTCEASNSICQYCYGWSLANDTLVDLGEAVGIIAAQSIGEPGTQLTMRTFHTGGVFTGEVAKQIRAEYSGKVVFSKSIKSTDTRTRHGDIALLNLESLTIHIENTLENQKQEINLPEGTTMFSQNKQYVEKGELIAELPIGSRLGKEKAYRQISTDISGQIYFTDLIIEETQNKQQTRKVTKSGGLIWILSGKVYNIPSIAEIMVRENEKVRKGQALAQIKIINQYPGKVFIPTDEDKTKAISDIYIITNSILFNRPRIYIEHSENNKIYLLETSSHDKFLMHNVFSQKLYNYQVIGNLITDTYKTRTGGMIKYLDLPVEKCKIGNQESFEVQSGGYILWVEEETHEINKDVSLLLVKQGDSVESGTEMVKNIFCKHSGIIEIVQKDDIIREIIIKPGKLFPMTEKNNLTRKRKGFLRPGETILDLFKADNIVYWEHITIDTQSFILVRPVYVYSVPNSIPSLEQEFNKKSDYELGLKVVRNICFKDGEKVKSVDGVELIKTQLVTILPSLNSNLTARLHLEHTNIYDQEKEAFLFQLRLVVLETLSIDNKLQQKNENQDTVILVKNHEVIDKGTVIAKTKIFTNEDGEIQAISSENQQNKRVLNLTSEHLTEVIVPNASQYWQKMQWVKVGDPVSENQQFPCSGQILRIDENSLIIRNARPYLVSDQTILYVSNKDLVKQGELLATLSYETFKTGDIVQGLPRIEEILEVRKKNEGPNNPHTLLENKFSKYLQKNLDLHEAARLSIEDLQLFLIEAIQSVYKSQGVEIADKHIEIIVRQMSLKARIISGGDTGYLPGDLVELQKLEKRNQIIKSMSQKTSFYAPVLLGITKASLNTDSFISAASFQETTKILTEAAISGKLDWLKGLKENVIIGRLIPAGTGFGSYNAKSSLENSSSTYNKNVTNINEEKEYSLLKSNVDDIILDDRTLRNYPF